MGFWSTRTNARTCFSIHNDFSAPAIWTKHTSELIVYTSSLMHAALVCCACISHEALAGIQFSDRIQLHTLSPCLCILCMWRRRKRYIKCTQKSLLCQNCALCTVPVQWPPMANTTNCWRWWWRSAEPMLKERKPLRPILFNCLLLSFNKSAHGPSCYTTTL